MILSVQEHNVITLAACGFTDKEIAIKLNISDRTVHTYFERIFRKLKANCKINAAVIYSKKNRNWQVSERHLLTCEE